MRVLITAFEPFGSNDINASLEVLNQLPTKIEDSDIIKVVLPTAFKKATEHLNKALETYNPDALISMGEAGGRSTITVERIAINLDDARIADNDNQQPHNQQIRENGDDGYFSTLPIEQIVEEITSKQIPAAISNTAGTYVCNHVMYEGLYWNAKQESEIPAGFIHLPYLPNEVVTSKKSLPSMSLETLTKAIKIVIKTVINR